VISHVALKWSTGVESLRKACSELQRRSIGYTGFATHGSRVCRIEKLLPASLPHEMYEAADDGSKCGTGSDALLSNAQCDLS
jgi:hypothetical protein